MLKKRKDLLRKTGAGSGSFNLYLTFSRKAKKIVRDKKQLESKEG
jgi:hypothetical protein